MLVFTTSVQAFTTAMGALVGAIWAVSASMRAEGSLCGVCQFLWGAILAAAYDIKASMRAAHPAHELLQPL